MAERSLSFDPRLGQGWALPVRLAPDGDIALVAGEQAVGQSIWTILATAPGERVGQPDFGCGIHDLVFAPSDGGTAAAMAELVRSALTVWEPRINLTGVRVQAQPGEARL